MPGSPLPSHNRTRLARRWRQRDVSTRPVHLVSHVHVQLAFHADTLHRVTQPWSCTNERVAWADGNSTATMFVEHGLSRVETADLVLRQTGHRRPRCTLWDRVIASQPRNRAVRRSSSRPAAPARLRTPRRSRAQTQTVTCALCTSSAEQRSTPFRIPGSLGSRTTVVPGEPS
jgi:hypothetical protein